MAKIAEECTRMTLGVGLLVVVCALASPSTLDAAEHKVFKPSLSNQNRNASLLATAPATAAATTTATRNSTLARATTNDTKPTHAPVRKVNSRLARGAPKSLGDSISLDTAIDSHRDLMTAAGEHGKKYILVKKKPKHKKIKMEVYKPKMKYKKIKMKVPVKKMKKKKVKGYLVKKEKHYH